MLKNLMVLAIALGFSATAYGVATAKNDHKASGSEMEASASGSEMMEGSASEEMKK
jgi:hypothetical protein